MKQRTARYGLIMILVLMVVTTGTPLVSNSAQQYLVQAVRYRAFNCLGPQ